MAEPEPPRTPDTRAAGTASWIEVPPFDGRAVAGTAPYPNENTASFAAAPADAATGTFGGDPTDPAPSPDLPQIPGYKVLSVLGDGGMGTVFKALHLKMNKVVALKLIKSGWARDRDFHTRFALEVETLARLDHPNVVPIFDASSWCGLPYLTMKFVTGKTLYHHLERVRRDPPAAARLLAKVARAVHYLHQRGIVHRDLKPLNILLDAGDEPMVADFGLVKLADDDQGHSISLVPLGTRQYMSPEQTLGGAENYKPACDIWALGIILYEVLAGHRPFSHEDTAELYRMIRLDPVPPLPARASAPVGLEAIARKCLAKSIGDRYATAEEVANDLDKWAAGETIPMPRERTPRRRVRVGAVVLVALLGFSGGTPKPVPAQPRQPLSLDERLAAHERVYLIGPRGELLVPQSPVPGLEGALVPGRGGYASLSSSDMVAVELWSAAVGHPVRVRAEYAYVTEQNETSQAGAYIGHKRFAAGNYHSLIRCGHRERLKPAPTPNDPGAMELTEFAHFDLYVWDRGPGARTTFPQHARKSRVTHDDGAPLRWYALDIVIRPDALTATWDGIEVPAVYTERAPDGNWTRCVKQQLDNQTPDLRGKPPRFQPPYIGPGIGLSVYKATAVFRNVSIERVTP